MKNMKIMLCLFIVASILFIPEAVYAATSKLSASSTTVYVGDTVTVTATITGKKMYFVKGTIASANSNVLSGSGSLYRKADLSTEQNGFSSVSSSVTFTAKSAGRATVSFTPNSGNIDVGGNDLSIQSSSVNITVLAKPTNQKPQKPTTVGSSSGGNNTPSYNIPDYETPVTNEQEEPKSSNAELEELSISKGELSPEFSSGKTNYTVMLEKDVTSLNVTAKAKDSKATVRGDGETALKPGNNEITITVTAEDGTVKKYVIKAMVDESPDVFVNYNGKNLGVVKNSDDAQIPATFEKTMVSLEGKNVEAWHSNLANLTILYMIDDKNEKNFYLYDDTSKMVTSVYKPIALLGRQVAIIDVPKELQTRIGMRFQEVEVDSLKFNGWIYEEPDFENYVLLYLMDDKGKMHYYLYEKSENSLQLYSNQAAVTQATYDKLNEDMKLRMIVLLALAGTNVLTLLLLLIVSLRIRKKNRVRIEPAVKNKPSLNKKHEGYEEEIEPFDSWKYETMPEETHTIHMKPYDDEQHLFEEIDDSRNR